MRETLAHPDLLRQRIEEAEEARLLLDRLLDHDRDAERHERFAEVNDPLALRCDGHGSDGDVGLAANQFTHDAVPSSSHGGVLRAVLSVLDNAHLVCSTEWETRDGTKWTRREREAEQKAD